MSVSVIIPHYGDPGPTIAVARALAPQVGPDGEVIVADDHSPTPFPALDGVRVIRRASNGGFGANCNTGASVATGDLLLFCNSDLDVPDDFVSRLVEAAAPWQPCVAGPVLLESDGHPSYSARHFPAPRHQIVEWLIPLARWRSSRTLHEWVGHDTRAHEAQTATPTDWLVGAALLVPRAEFSSVGGFDERFHMNAEEVDLQRRLRDRGTPSVLLPQVRAIHHGGGSSDSNLRRRWLVTARFAYARKWGGVARLRAGLTVASLANLAWNAGRRVAGRQVTPVRTFREEIDLVWSQDTGRPTPPSDQR